MSDPGSPRGRKSGWFQDFKRRSREIIGIKPRVDIDVAHEQAVREFVEECTGVHMGHDLHHDLKSGEVLCRLANAVRPGSVKLIHSSMVAFKQMENIANFLATCAAAGLPSGDLFQTSDLYEEKDMHRVISCLFALRRIVRERRGAGRIMSHSGPLPPLATAAHHNRGSPPPDSGRGGSPTSPGLLGMLRATSRLRKGRSVSGSSVASASSRSDGASSPAATERRGSIDSGRVVDEAALDDEILDEICKQMTVRKFEAGERIVEVESIGDEMYFILDGEVEVDVPGMVDDHAALPRLHSGDFFGEIAMFIKGKRTANVRALTHTTLYCLSADSTDDILFRYPGLYERFKKTGQDRLEHNSHFGKIREEDQESWMHKIATRMSKMFSSMHGFSVPSGDPHSARATVVPGLDGLIPLMHSPNRSTSLMSDDQSVRDRSISLSPAQSPSSPRVRHSGAFVDAPDPHATRTSLFLVSEYSGNVDWIDRGKHRPVFLILCAPCLYWFKPANWRAPPLGAASLIGAVAHAAPDHENAFAIALPHSKTEEFVAEDSHELFRWLTIIAACAERRPIVIPSATAPLPLRPLTPEPAGRPAVPQDESAQQGGEFSGWLLKHKRTWHNVYVVLRGQLIYVYDSVTAMKPLEKFPVFGVLTKGRKAHSNAFSFILSVPGQTLHRFKAPSGVAFLNWVNVISQAKTLQEVLPPYSMAREHVDILASRNEHPVSAYHLVKMRRGGRRAHYASYIRKTTTFGHHRYYLILHNRRLYYFKDAHAEKPSESACVVAYAVVEPPTLTPKTATMFTLSHPGMPSHTLEADTRTEALTWIRLLRKAASMEPVPRQSFVVPEPTEHEEHVIWIDGEDSETEQINRSRSATHGARSPLRTPLGRRPSLGSASPTSLGGLHTVAEDGIAEEAEEQVDPYDQDLPINEDWVDHVELGGDDAWLAALEESFLADERAREAPLVIPATLSVERVSPRAAAPTTPTFALVMPNGETGEIAPPSPTHGEKKHEAFPDTLAQSSNLLEARPAHLGAASSPAISLHTPMGSPPAMTPPPRRSRADSSPAPGNANGLFDLGQSRSLQRSSPVLAGSLGQVPPPFPAPKPVVRSPSPMVFPAAAKGSAVRPPLGGFASPRAAVSNENIPRQKLNTPSDGVRHRRSASTGEDPSTVAAAAAAAARAWHGKLGESAAGPSPNARKPNNLNASAAVVGMAGAHQEDDMTLEDVIALLRVWKRSGQESSPDLAKLQALRAAEESSSSGSGSGSEEEEEGGKSKKTPECASPRAQLAAQSRVENANGPVGKGAGKAHPKRRGGASGGAGGGAGLDNASDKDGSSSGGSTAVGSDEGAAARRHRDDEEEQGKATPVVMSPRARGGDGKSASNRPSSKRGGAGVDDEEADYHVVGSDSEVASDDDAGGGSTQPDEDDYQHAAASDAGSDDANAPTPLGARDSTPVAGAATPKAGSKHGTAFPDVVDASAASAPAQEVIEYEEVIEYVEVEEGAEEGAVDGAVVGDAKIDPANVNHKVDVVEDVRVPPGSKQSEAASDVVLPPFHGVAGVSALDGATPPGEAEVEYEEVIEYVEEDAPDLSGAMDASLARKPDTPLTADHDKIVVADTSKPEVQRQSPDEAVVKEGPPPLTDTNATTVPGEELIEYEEVVEYVVEGSDQGESSGGND